MSSLFRGFERFLGGGGDIFRVIIISIFMCMGRLKLSKGGLNFHDLRFSHRGDGLIGRVTSKELKNFSMEFGFFEKLRIFKWGVGSVFIMVEVVSVVETFTIGSDVFSFSCRLRFFMAGGGEG